MCVVFFFGGFRVRQKSMMNNKTTVVPRHIICLSKLVLLYIRGEKGKEEETQ